MKLKKILLRKCKESFDTGIVKKIRKCQDWSKKVLIK